MDPNNVIGEPTTSWVWLAPDWSDFNPTQKKGSNWTRVQVRETRYADGRIVTNVLDENNQPIATRALDTQTDKEQEKRFKEAQTAAQRQTDQSERRVTSEYPSTYPEGHPQAGQPAMRTDYESGPSKYAPMPASAANAVPQGSYPQIEGTRRTDGTYDNSQPVKVWHGPSGPNGEPGPIVKVEELDAGERSDWERRKNASAGVGSYTDTQISEQARQPADPVGKPTGNTRQKTDGGTTTKETEYLLPNGTKEWRTQTATEPTQATDLVGKPTGNTRQRTDGGKTVKETEYILPNGTKEWRTQEETGPAPQPQSKYVKTQFDDKTQKWWGLTKDDKWELMQGGPGTEQVSTPNGMPTFTPDISKPGFGVIEYAQQLAALKSQGTLTDAQVAQFVTAAHQQVTSEAGRLDALIGVQRQLQANEVTQRNTDVNASTQRLGLANQATANALSTSMEMAGNFTPKSYAAMGKPILPAILALQDARANAWGGMNMPGRVDNSQYPALNAVGGMGLNSPAPTAQPGLFAPGGGGAPAAPAPAVTISADGRAAVAPDGSTAPVDVNRQAPQMQQQGITNTTDAGGVPRAYSPAQSTNGATGLPPVQTAPPPMPQIDQQPVGMQPQQSQPTVLPAAIQMGVVAELAQSGRYPSEILREAASRLGWG